VDPEPLPSSDAETGKNKEIDQHGKNENDHEVIDIPHPMLGPGYIFAAVLTPARTFRYFSFALGA
jgi:hypothetical protein